MKTYAISHEWAGRGRVPVAILLVIAATGYAYERSDDVDDMAVTQITLLGP